MTDNNPQSTITPVQIRAVCLLYRAMIDAGREHDDVAELVSSVAPHQLVTDTGDVDIEMVSVMATRWAPVEVDRSPQAAAGRYLTAISLVEGMLSGDRTANALMPKVAPEVTALLVAQCGLTKMVLDNWCKGPQTAVLSELRKLILAHMVDTDGDAK